MASQWDDLTEDKLSLSTSGQNAETATSAKIDRYYRGGHWGQCLELLQHLCKYSDSILMVCAADGMGKSTLRQALMETDPEQFKFCALQAHLEFDAQSILDQVASGFNLPNVGDSISGLKSQLIEQQKYDDKMYVVAIDDADLLNAQAVKSLLHLVLDEGADANQALPLHLVLFAQIEFEKKITNTKWLGCSIESQLHAIELEPLSLQETENYLLHKWRLVGNHSDLPFSKAIVKKIHQLSRGVPKEVERLAQASLAGDSLKQNGIKAMLKKLISPIGFGLLIFITVAILLVAMLMALDSEQRIEKSVQQAEVLEAPAVGSNTNIHPQKLDNFQQLAKNSAQNVPLPRQVNNEAQGESQLTADQAVVLTDLNSQLRLQQDQLKDAGIQKTKLEAELKVKSTELAKEKRVRASTEAQITQLQQKFDALLTEKLALQQEIKALENKQSQAVQAEAKASEMASKVKSLVQAKREPQVQTPVAQPKKKATLALTINEKDLINKPKNNYTLQLLGTSKEQGVKQFIKQHQLTGHVAYYKGLRQGKPWFIVLYGDYASQQEAQLAIQGLPQAVQTLKPWPRQFKHVQQSILRK